MSVVLTIADFKAQFDRGQFTYSETLPDIRDKDITSAIAEAEAVFNHNLYPTEVIEKQALLYLTAHFLQNDIEASESGGQVKLLQASRSADGLSESNAIPDWMNNGDFALYATTYYGQKFLTISRPYLVGAVYAIGGATQF
jgi:hypothetical protein